MCLWLCKTCTYKCRVITGHFLVYLEILRNIVAASSYLSRSLKRKYTKQPLCSARPSSTFCQPSPLNSFTRLTLHFWRQWRVLANSTLANMYLYLEVTRWSYYSYSCKLSVTRGSNFVVLVKRKTKFCQPHHLIWKTAADEAKKKIFFYHSCFIQSSVVLDFFSSKIDT